MFVLTTLVYPLVLALLCLGAGLLIDRVSGRPLPAELLPPVGAAALIVVSQLLTSVPTLAPATPELDVAVAAAGLVLGWPRLRSLAGERRRPGWPALLLVAYVIALAPVLFAGRATFSSYMGLTDSALHMVGADYLIHHGQTYGALDLHSSYGELISAYFNNGYPSGSHTLFGSTALILGLPLIWAFQPFNAFMLAIGIGPLSVLARRAGLRGGWAAAAALTGAVPALVYGYELVGSLKEVVALPLILTMAALVTTPVRLLRSDARTAVPFAVVAAGGLAALGVAFGVWIVVALAIAVLVAVTDVAAGRRRAGDLVRLGAVAAGVILIGALPTWLNVSASVQVASGIASATSPGNLTTPLSLEQVAGSWLSGRYEAQPVGASVPITHVLVAITCALAVLGASALVRRRLFALAGWITLMLLAWLTITAYTTVWTNAKTLMLTSPVVVLLAWVGVGELRRLAPRPAPVLAALVLAGGILASDAWQYHASDLAPTARYQELASVDARFVGRGPVLVTDFDEYTQYVLRDLDVSGPDFMFAPAPLRRVSPHHGSLVILDRVPPRVLRGYPLIVMRRDPVARRPPSAYRLLWQGTYYQLWGRRPGAPAALVHLGLSGAPVACTLVARLAQQARNSGALLVADRPGEVVNVPLLSVRRPPGWTHGGPAVGLVMRRAGRLVSGFRLPHSGGWHLWLQGELMRPVRVAIDGRMVGAIGDQVGGKKYISNVMTPLTVALAAGRHRITITRGGPGLAPGDGGSASLDAVRLTPAGVAGEQTLLTVAPARWRSLCGQRLDWIEVTTTAA